MNRTRLLGTLLALAAGCSWRARDLPTAPPPPAYCEGSWSDLDPAERQELRRKRQESMGFLEDVLLNRACVSCKDELLVILANHYEEESFDLHLDEVQAFYAAQEACVGTPGCDLAGVRLDDAASRAWRERALKLYGLVVTHYPSSEYAAEAEFSRASALQDLGSPDEAAAQLIGLVRRWPASPYAPEAYLRLGDHFFARQEIQAALLAYTRASRDKSDCAYGPALYGLAWSHYELGSHRDAINALRALVAYTQAPAHPSDRGRRQRLQSDALSALVRFYAASPDVVEPYEHLSALGRPQLTRRYLEELADLHADQGDLQPALELYRWLLAQEPLSPEAPRYQRAIALVYRQAGRLSDAQVEIERMKSAYGPGSGWALANAADAAALQRAAWMTADLLSGAEGDN